MKELVLVTGISGYIARHVALALLSAGYRVRGTVRSIEKADLVLQDLRAAGADLDRLSIVEADLENDEKWAASVEGCTYIQHIASPFPADQPADREVLVPAARAGTQRVLAAGFSANVERIVMTSSLVAMMGKPGKGAHMEITEDDWTDPEWRALNAYAVSKTRAELSAWEYARVQEFESKLTVINPGFVLGPAIGRSYGTSVRLIEEMFKGEFKRTPKVSLVLIDVRDLAQLHVTAMTAAKAKGRRLIGASETLWLKDIVNVLRREFPTQGKDLPRGEYPNIVVKIGALFNERARGIISNLGTHYTVENKYVQEITGITYRPVQDTIVETANYLIDAGKV